MTETSDHSDKIKTLDYIQAIITRMSTASFSIKTAFITICGAFIALAPKVDYCHYNWKSYLIFIPLFSFWYLDAFYLRIERCFRHLYNSTRVSEKNQKFSLDISPYLVKETLWRALILPPLSILYASLIVVLFIFILLS